MDGRDFSKALAKWDFPDPGAPTRMIMSAADDVFASSAAINRIVIGKDESISFFI